MTNYAIHLAGSTGGRYASVAVATALPQALTTLATDLGAASPRTPSSPWQKG